MLCHLLLPLLPLLLFAPKGLADFAGEVPGAIKPQVVFFGGYGSNLAQQKNWAQAAQATRLYGQNFDFTVPENPSVAYRGARSWLQPATLQNNRELIQQWVDKIDHSPAGSIFLLAGHSSGSALSNAIAARVKEPGKVKLIVLDGFNPKDVPATVDVQCWSAVDGNDVRNRSLNTSSMEKCAHYNPPIKPRDCPKSGSVSAREFCLHFSLINQNAGKLGVTDKNYSSRGYGDIKPNLNWLDRYLHFTTAE